MHFCVVVYWECSNKTPIPIYICIGFVDAVLRPEILDITLGILNKILIAMDYYFLFLNFKELPSI